MNRIKDQKQTKRKEVTEYEEKRNNRIENRNLKTGPCL